MSALEDVQSQFTKRELSDLSKELGLEFTSDDSKQSMISLMITEGNKIAHSEEDVDISGLLMDFLIVAEVVDEDGNPLMKEEVQEEITHKCYGYWDDKDPACGKCKIASLCKKKRLSNRPKCYGKFSSSVDECRSCFEAALCKLVK